MTHRLDTLAITATITCDCGWTRTWWGADPVDGAVRELAEHIGDETYTEVEEAQNQGA